ncbi:MAG: serine hydrolase domain-containing protein [Actinomycetes bacterium]
MPRPLPAPLAASFDRKALEAQRAARTPALAAVVVRDGAEVWRADVGLADVQAGTPPRPDTQFRMGSITKTFTAALVMQCRDDGLLDLDDRLEQHLPGVAHGQVTLRRMLSHLSGLQREPVGEVWETLQGPSREELLAGVSEAELVLPTGRRWHYSNLAFALLGEVVARRRNQTWKQALRERILDPLGMTRTTLSRTFPYAGGYLTDPYADRVLPEPEFPGYGFAPAAELWSSASDLGRWADVLSGRPGSGADAILRSETWDEMASVTVMVDTESWTLGWGLGLMVHRRGNRLFVGHDGAMPGFLASLVVRRQEGVGAVVMVNTSARADPTSLALDLVASVVDEDPEPLQPWQPGRGVPPELEDLLGVWWTEGNQFVFSVRDGRLEARAAGAPASKAPAVFAPVGPDVWRVESGREHGELLRVVRDDDGRVAKLYWATYPVTRECLPFGG